MGADIGSRPVSLDSESGTDKWYMALDFNLRTWRIIVICFGFKR